MEGVVGDKIIIKILKIKEGSQITWGRFASVTNEEIIRLGDEIGGSEDKRLGAYFAKTEELTEKRFPEKVLKYLWDDAFKMDRYTYFNNSMSSMDTIIEVFNNPKPGEDLLKQVLRLAVYSKMLGQTGTTSDDSEQTTEEDPDDQ